MLAPGTEIDRYIVEAQIGEGGMAAVYRVRHATLGTRHALKVLQISNKDVRERTIQEGQVQAKLRNRHVVSVTDVLDVDGSPGLLMEFVRGPALDHWLYQYQPSLDEALTVFRGIVAGVGYAHSKGLVHRDLKSANIMLQIDDDLGVVPKVTDFGLAKVARPDGRMTRSGTTMGTPTFMAPEQIRDASSVDRRADLYSLGCILYELVCGRTPHVGDDVIQLFAEVASGRYPHPREFRPEVSNAIVDCIEGLVEVSPEHRLQDCAAILELLNGSGRNTFGAATALDTLPPPRPMPNPGKTVLDHGSPGAARAALFLSQLSTPPMVLPHDPGSMAPIETDFDGETVRVDVDRQYTPDPARPQYGLLAVVAMLGPMAIAAGVGFGVLVLLIGWTVTNRGGPSVADPPRSTEPVVEPPTPLPPTPRVDPVAARPAPVPQPDVEPQPPVAPPPVSQAPPRPAVPAPATRPAPSTGGTFVVTGARATLQGDAGSFSEGQSVPPGRYSVMAVFGDAGPAAVAGKVSIKAGEKLSITCDPAFHGCVGR